MEDLLELILSVIDDLTGNKLDRAIDRLAGKLTKNIENAKAKKIAHALVWVMVIALPCAVIFAVALLIEAQK